MNKQLLDLYRRYAHSEEAFAVLFVRQYLEQSKGFWVDIIDSRRFYQYNDYDEIDIDNKLCFKFVECGLYPKKIKPEYPPKTHFFRNGVFDERRYYLMVRAITWQTAHKDIEQQKLQGVKPLKFKIIGNLYKVNNTNTGYFRDDAPPEIKKLADNLNDRTNPLWDIAPKYFNEPKFLYEIKNIKRLR